jgi:hypothetical protein
MSEPLSRALQAELDRRDDLILALEMLSVDLAARLLALEALTVCQAAGNVEARGRMDSYIEREAERFRGHFETIDGFIRRAQRLGGEMAAGGSAAKGAPNRKAGKTAKGVVKLPAKAKGRAAPRKKPA